MKRTLNKGLSVFMAVMFVFATLSMAFAAAFPTGTVISVTNDFLNAGTTKDKISITGLASGDIVKIYSDESLKNLIGTATLGATVLATTKNTISLTSNLPNVAYGVATGDVYITVTRSGSESDAYKQSYTPVQKSNTVATADVTIVNNYNMNDTITIKTSDNVATGDIIKVYDAATAGNLLGTVTIAANKSTGVISIPKPTATSVKKLSSDEAGTVYVTLTKKTLTTTTPATKYLESDRIPVSYIAEQTSVSDAAKPIFINTDNSDLVVIYGLAPGDIVEVYKTETDLKPTKLTVAKLQSFVTLSKSLVTGSTDGAIWYKLQQYGKKATGLIKVVQTN